MTYDTVNTEDESSGSLRSYYHTIDVTSLDSAGSEPYTPGNLFGINVEGVAVVGQESESYAVVYDHLAGALQVQNLTDGSAVAAGTDVGELILKVDGK